MNRWIDRAVLDLGACRILPQTIIPLPVPCRADWPWDKSATTVRAYVTQDLFYTGSAKCAFIAADASIQRIGWKGFVAIFTRGSEFKHKFKFSRSKIPNARIG